jgi:nonsense-mediated mRNA decay protein 3
MVTIPHASYWEAILQIRNPSQSLLDYIIKTVREDDRAAITKINKVKSGFDYYLTSQKYIQVLGKKIKARYKGEFKLSPTLHSQRKSGERLYRITILFREYGFKKGDVVLVHGDRYIVHDIRAKVMCKEELTGKKEWFNPEDITSIE